MKNNSLEAQKLSVWPPNLSKETRKEIRYLCFERSRNFTGACRVAPNAFSFYHSNSRGTVRPIFKKIWCFFKEMLQKISKKEKCFFFKIAYHYAQEVFFWHYVVFTFETMMRISRDGIVSFSREMEQGFLKKNTKESELGQTLTYDDQMGLVCLLSVPRS